MLPILTTPRLLLHAATEADLDRLWALLLDPQVRRYLCDDRELTRAEVAEMLAHSRTQWPAGMGMWMLCQEGQPVGCVGLHPVSALIADHVPPIAGEIEPTIALAPDRWGQGLAHEALEAAIAHGFDGLGLEHLVAVVDEPNQASHRLMARVGFVATGSASGRRYPLRIYRLLRPAFRSGDL
jgi:RimJ/RimL family protein N-acetyltransferase